MSAKYIVLGFLYVMLSMSCTSKEDQSPQKDDQEVFTKVVKIHKIDTITESSKIKVMGIVMSESEARPSFKTGGVIRTTYSKEGDIVTKGQLLATLEMTEINAQVSQAEQALGKAERDLKRVENLYRDSVATLEQYQNVKTAFEVARHTAEAARFNKKYSEIRSPISGKVVKQIMYHGEITGPGNPVYVILGTGKQDWVIRAGLTDRDWVRTKEGDAVAITMDAYPGRNFTGMITNKSSVGGNASGTFDVEIKMHDAPSELAVGLTADISIEPSIKQNLKVIPVEALVKTNGKTGYVFTVQDGKAHQVQVEIGRLLGDKVAISSGLEGIYDVVTTGAIYLEEGDAVRY